MHAMQGTIVSAGLRKGRSPVAGLLMVTLLSGDAVSGRSCTSTGRFMYILARQNHTSGTVHWQRGVRGCWCHFYTRFIHANV